MVQVVHQAGDHWVTVSNKGCSKRDILVYDSLPSLVLSSRKIRKSIEAQCATILKTSGTFRMKYAKCQVRVRSNVETHEDKPL